MSISAELLEWLRGQHPAVRKLAKPVHLEDDDHVYHVSPGKISRFYPRVPTYTSAGEDATVGRVCCSLDVSKAMWGGRHHFPCNRVYIYEFAERDVLLPSVTLTQEGKRGNEVWIVPYCLSNWNIKPTLVGEMRLVEQTDVNESTTVRHSIYALRVMTDEMIFCKDVVLEAGKTYSIKVTTGTTLGTTNKDSVEFLGELPGEMFNMAALEYTVKL